LSKSNGLGYGNIPEAEIVCLCKCGDELAFEEIVKKLRLFVREVASRILYAQNREDIEDVVQNVFIKVYSNIRNFNQRSKLKTWVYRITVNECGDFLRKQMVRKIVIYESSLAAADNLERSGRPSLSCIDFAADSGTANDLQSELKNYLGRLLSVLSEEDRQLLILKEVCGHSIKELVELTGVNSENVIKLKLYRIRLFLRKRAEVLRRRSLRAVASASP